jgi:tetratricopeptide (TPR) repeat protein
MATEIDPRSIALRRLMLRDSLSILSLTFATVVLFFITLFLFRSSSAHRANLAQRWSDRGRDALNASRPAEAIVDLRTALTYAPGTRSYQFLLAQALGEAGHTEESYQYFLTLWDAEPGNGLINLQIARLAAQRKDRQAAVNFYRASIYGTWEGDGVARRAEVRLELARYLIQGGNLEAARLELLIAGGNAPDNYDRDMAVASLLQQTQDTADAWTYYQRAIAARPSDIAALAAAGRLAYQAGDYQNAERLLSRAQDSRLAGRVPAASYSDDLTLMDNATRILQLLPLPSEAPRERVAHILADREIARKRLDACAAHLAPDDTSLQDLDSRWPGDDGKADDAELRRDPALQDSAMQLVYDTEMQTARACGAPAGDDALLLRLATTPHGISLPAAAAAAPAPVARD